MRPVSRAAGGTLVPPRRLHPFKTSCTSDDFGRQIINSQMVRRLA